MSKTQVDSFVLKDNLDSLYKADCANYMTEVFKILENYVNNLKYSGDTLLTPDKVKLLNTRMETLKGICKDGKFVYDGDATFTSADTTYNTNDENLLKVFKGLGILKSDSGYKLATDKTYSVDYSITLANKFQTLAKEYLNGSVTSHQN